MPAMLPWAASVAGGRGLDVVLGAGGDVVEVDRRRHRVGDGREVADEAVLGAAWMKKGVMTAMPSTPIAANSWASRMVSKVAGMPALTMTLRLAADLVDDLAAEPDLLVEGERGEVAVGAGAHDVVAGGDLAADLGAGGGVVQRSRRR